MRSIYIAGKMRGIPFFNFPAFDAARDKLNKEGWGAVSPADLDRVAGFDALTLPSDYDWNEPQGFDFDACVTRDIIAVRKCDAIYLLKGWETSTGARAEKALAEWCGKEIIYEVQTETLVIDPVTGGRKGQKLARFDLIQAVPLWLLAEHYGKGCAKYADRNWERGYKWSLSFAALQRHAWAFWGGEDMDPETGSPHIISAAWHALALAEFRESHPELDDRVKA